MVSIALVLFVLGAIGYATAGIFRSAHKVSEGVTMIVELRDGLQEPHRDSLASDPITKDLLCHGFSVLSEKPFGRSYYECLDLIHTAQKKGLSLKTYQNYIYQLL